MYEVCILSEIQGEVCILSEIDNEVCITSALKKNEGEYIVLIVDEVGNLLSDGTNVLTE